MRRALLHDANPELREAIDLIADGAFSGGDGALFRPARGLAAHPRRLPAVRGLSGTMWTVNGGRRRLPRSADLDAHIDPQCREGGRVFVRSVDRKILPRDLACLNRNRRKCDGQERIDDLPGRLIAARRRSAPALHATCMMACQDVAAIGVDLRHLRRHRGDMSRRGARSRRWCRSSAGRGPWLGIGCGACRTDFIPWSCSTSGWSRRCSRTARRSSGSISTRDLFRRGRGRGRSVARDSPGAVPHRAGGAAPHRGALRPRQARHGVARAPRRDACAMSGRGRWGGIRRWQRSWKRRRPRTGEHGGTRAPRAGPRRYSFRARRRDRHRGVRLPGVRGGERDAGGERRVAR